MKWYQDYSSIFKILSKGRVALLISACASSVLVAAPANNALPTNPSVVSGQISVSANSAKMTVTQASDKGIINWGSFNIGSSASVQFVQPNASASTLNRVVGGEMSQIMGSLSANGQIILINPNGVLFGAGSRVDVGGMVASTMNLSDSNYQNSIYKFTRDGATGTITNAGTLNAAKYIALLAPEVQNEGVVSAGTKGTVAFGAGEAVTLDFAGDGLIGMSVDAATMDTLIANKNIVQTDGGTVIMSARALNAAYSSTVSNAGTISASSLTEVGGKIVLTADNLTLKSGSNTQAKGAKGGGEVLVGGDWQGSNGIYQAKTVTMEAGAAIDASATDSGNGGKVVLWSDIHNPNSLTTANGSILARGDANGGQIETSGHSVNTDGITVNAGANKGTGGLWLIDPYNYTINSTAATNIVSALNSGTSVTVTTTADNSSYGSTGSGTGTITVSNAINATTANGGALTLSAASDITVGAAIATVGGITLTSGGNIALNANLASTGSGAAITVSATDNISTANSAKTITTNNGNITIAADSDANGAGQMDIDYTTMSAGTGNVTLRAKTVTWSATGAGVTPTISSTTGAFTFESSDASFGQSVNASWFILPSTLSGLTIGKSTNTYDIVLNSALSAAGAINIYGGNITVNANLNTSNGNANGNILLKGTGNITQGTSITVQTNGGNITYWADSDNSGAGGIYIQNSSTIDSRTTTARSSSLTSTASGGGKITLAGGLDDGSNNGTASDGIPDGYAVNWVGTTTAGIRLGNDSNTGQNSAIGIYSGGGDIKMNGKLTSNSIGGYQAAISAFQGLTVNAGLSGNLKMLGTATLTANQLGVDLAYQRSTSYTASSYFMTNNGNLSITGSATGGTNNLGIAADGVGSNRMIFAATGTGTVTMTGTGATQDIRFDGADILAASGAITLVGTTSSGISFSNWNGAIGDYLGAKSGSLVGSSSSNITMRANAVSFTDATTINTTGTLTIEPYSTSFTSALTYPITNLTVSAGLTGLTLGKAGNTTDITISSAQSIAGAINIYGGNIIISGNLNTSGGGANGDILLKASGAITQSASKSITTNGGDVTLWADSDGTNGGYIWLNSGSSISTTTAANIILSGGNVADTTALATTGYAMGMTTVMGSGVTIDAATLSSYGGNITIRGKSTAGANTNYTSSEGSKTNASGIRTHGSVTVDSGSGLLSMYGYAQATTGAANGIEFSETGTSVFKSSSTSTNAISIDGTAANSAATNAWGVYLWSGTSVLATGGGGVTITGSAAKQAGVTVGTGASILANSGAIALTGTGYGAGYNAVDISGNVGQKSGSTITSSSSNITISGNLLSLTGAIASTGQLTLQSYGTSFASAFTVPSSSVLSSALTGLTIGKTTNTANITIGSATSIAGPINVYGGWVNIAANLDTSSGTATGDILVKAAGNIGQATGITVKTNAGNITYWADSDGSGAGGIFIASSATIDSRTSADRTASNTTAATGGGTITLAGGTTTSTLGDGTVCAYWVCR